jgi:hypothetical protein
MVNIRGAWEIWVYIYIYTVSALIWGSVGYSVYVCVVCPYYVYIYMCGHYRREVLGVKNVCCVPSQRRCDRVKRS